ncbi:MAG TPA: hypothetical protein VF807_07780 [Ktedonobacterales bacterium]
MTLREKQLYHQIHPLKLVTDISASIVSTYFFWMQQLGLGLLTMFLPPIIVSTIMLLTLDFTWIKDSAVGRYLKRSMTPAMEALRLLGTLPMVLGAWWHQWWLIAAGVLIVLFGWLRGLILPRQGNRDAVSAI